jgi:urease accessory protein
MNITFTDPRVSLLQFADGLFPAGGHAHSFGLETYVSDGRVRDRAGLEAFLHACLEGAVGPCEAVIVAAALRLGERHELEELCALDAELDAMRPAGELREASRQMGRQTLRVAASLFDAPTLARFAARADEGSTPAHHPVVFGLVGGVLGWPVQAAVQAYLQASATVVVSAALRLLAMGELEGQQALWSVGELIARLAGEAADKDVRDIWSFTPGLEVAAMQHSRLEARLFRS